MRDELLSYYERELTYLRQLGSEFAGKYPKIAARLNLEPDRCEDPHVERLLEGVAFLGARIRHKLDDELPEITDSILDLLYPHYLAPMPSMSIVQFQLDADQAQLAGAYEIPRHATLTARARDGIRCRFRTCYPVTLWPIEIVAATLEDPPKIAPLGGARDFNTRALIRLTLRLVGGVTFAQLQIPMLRFHLVGETSLTVGLYEMLCSGARQVELHAPAGKDPGRSVVLPRGVITPVGFARDETALPLSKRSFRGYGLLREYFSFPEKFLFVDLAGLDRAAATGATDTLEIRIFCAQKPRFDQALQPDAFRVGCTPIVNLFEKSAEPIWVDHTKHEYRVVPDVHAPKAHEVYSVDAVTSATLDLSEIRTFESFYSFRHGFEGDGGHTYWHASRRQALDGASDVYLSLVDSRFSRSSPPVETLSLQLTCTNRDLPAMLPFSGTFGGDFDGEDISPLVRIRCLGKPTTPQRPAGGRGAHWRLISHLSLNYLSIVEHGKEALQGILELYDLSDSAVTKRHIAGITDVQSARVVRNVGGAFCRGLRVTLELDPQQYVGSGVYLFAAVLENFLGLYASLNSFSQLVARLRHQEEPLRTWPPRAGEQILL